MKFPEYLKFIKRHVCTVCGDTETEAHHVKTVGAGGSDLLALPLCRDHHMEVHILGVRTFQERHGFDFRDAQIHMLCHFIEACSQDPEGESLH